MDRTDRTRATFLIAALAVTLAAAAAGIGAYVAVRQNARASNTTVEQPAPENRMAAALDGIAAEAAAGEPGSGSGIAVESTEQVVEPAPAPAAAPPPATHSRAGCGRPVPRPSLPLGADMRVLGRGRHAELLAQHAVDAPAASPPWPRHPTPTATGDNDDLNAHH